MANPNLVINPFDSTVVDMLLRNNCSNPVYVEGMQAHESNPDGWNRYNFEGCCAEYEIVARKRDDDTYEVKSIEVK